MSRKKKKTDVFKSPKLLTMAVFCIIAVVFTVKNAIDDINQGNQASTAQQQGIFEMHVIDVGQGDSIYIKSQDCHILIDGGENGYDQVVSDYLTAMGVDRLDLVIATHPHSDHIGGLDTAVKNFKAKKIMMPQVPEDIAPNTVAYERLLDAIVDAGTQYLRPITGNSYEIGGSTMLVLDDGSKGKNLNDCSVVVKFIYKNTSFLLTGDAEKTEERRILSTGLDVSADILKIGHHGSSTSTSEEFFDAVAPQYAVMSLGYDNPYGCPHRETKSLLKEKGIRYYRTDLHSTVVFSSDGQSITVSTSDQNS